MSALKSITSVVFWEAPMNIGVILFPNCISERASWHSVRLILLKLPLSLLVFTDAAFTCYQNNRN